MQAVPNGTAKADLNMIGLDARDGGVTFVWEHSTCSVTPTADRLAGHHLRLLEQFVERPDARLSELAVSETRSWRRSSAGNPPTRYDRGATVPGLSGARPSGTAARPRSSSTMRGVAYGELWERRARSPARCGRAACGPATASGPRAALGAAVVAHLVLAAGAANVPLDPLHPEAQVEALRDAGIRVGLEDAGGGLRLPL